jgi:hypothetical protein
MSIYNITYDSNSQALALRAFEDSLIFEFVTNLRTMNRGAIQDLFESVWYAIDALSGYSPSDRVERLQKHVANKYVERIIQLSTPQNYFNLVTTRLSNPARLRQDLLRALNQSSSPIRSFEVSFLEYLLNIIQIRENMPAKNPFMSRDEEAMFGKCWDGYKKVGMKNKSGRRVPNCVRK